MRPGLEASLRMFCFPYAGGGASIFYNWQSALPPAIEVCAVQLPGREHLMRKPHYTQLPELVLAIKRAVAYYLDKPFVFYGHSMGGLLAFELARLLRRDGYPQPRHLLVSGCRAPHLAREERITYNLPEPELLEEIRVLNGTPEEVLEDPELMGVLLPTLRADFEVVETYEYATEPPLDCPISAFGGVKDEKVEYQHLEAWREHTTSLCSVRMLPGDHFFLRAARADLLQIIAQKLLSIKILWR
jgi:medium-chain acyl-[acyl-carrier-protein] hydrolase